MYALICTRFATGQLPVSGTHSKAIEHRPINSRKDINGFTPFGKKSSRAWGNLSNCDGPLDNQCQAHSVVEERVLCFVSVHDELVSSGLCDVV